jgi:hypothetical protein
MKEPIVAAGIIILIAGIALSALPFVYVSETVPESYELPKSEVILEGWTGMAAFASFKDATKGTGLVAGDLLNIQVNATQSKEIDFSVSAVNSNEEIIATYLSYPAVTTLNKDWIVPLTSEYHFSFSSNNLFTYKDATLLVTKLWIETAYRDVITDYRLLPIEFVYLGAVLTSCGIGLSALFYFKKRKREV